MKFNLKNLPYISRIYYKKCLDCENLQKRFEWFEGFEKELRELAAIYDKSEHVEHWAILQFIKEILGE